MIDQKINLNPYTGTEYFSAVSLNPFSDARQPIFDYFPIGQMNAKAVYDIGHSALIDWVRKSEIAAISHVNMSSSLLNSNRLLPDFSYFTNDFAKSLSKWIEETRIDTRILEFKGPLTDSADSEDADEDIQEPLDESQIEVPRGVFQVGFRVLRRINEDHSILYKMLPREFEKFVAHLFELEGFDVELTPETRDGGKDIIIARRGIGVPDEKFFVECKRYAPNNKVGIGVIHSFMGAMAKERPNGGLIVTTSTFSKDAQEFALSIGYQLQLRDSHRLKAWIRKLCQK